MKPTTYKHWRKIYHDQLRDLGLYSWFYFSGAERHTGLNVRRTIWYTTHRISRIKKLLDVEKDAFTDSYVEALLEMLHNRK